MLGMRQDVMMRTAGAEKAEMSSEPREVRNVSGWDQELQEY